MTVKGSVSVAGSRQMGKCSCFHGCCSEPQMYSWTLGVSLLKERGNWLLAEVVYSLDLWKSPLLSLPTFPYEMDGLGALLDEESGLQLLFTFHAVKQGNVKCALVDFRRCICSSDAFGLVATCWKHRRQGAAWWAQSSSSAGQQVFLPMRCCPLNLGHASGKATTAYCGLITTITGALWVRSSLCWLHYRPFNLLSSLMTSEPGGIGRRERSSAFLCVFPCEGLQRLIWCETASRAGREIIPTKEMPLKVVSATLSCKGQMWQHLGVGTEIHPSAKYHSPPPCEAWQSALVIWERGCIALAEGNMPLRSPGIPWASG